MNNPLLSKSTLEFELPDFQSLKDEHYMPAFENAVTEHNKQISSILNTLDVSFDNTIVALEKAGGLLNSMLMVFYNRSASDTNDQIQNLEAEIGPRLAVHNDSIMLNPDLFARLLILEGMRDKGHLELDQQSDWLLTKYLKDFRFAGADLEDEERARVTQINERLSSLEAEFDKRLMADTNDLAVNLETEEQLGGLSKSELASLKQAASDRNQTGYTIPLLNYSGHPLLANLEDRPLRQELMQRALSRGSRGNANDTSGLVRELLDLRREKAALFGYQNFAQYITSQQTAQTPKRIHEVLRGIAPAARRNAETEASTLEMILQDEIPNAKLESWDWDRYTEQVRENRFSIDTSVLKPYFELWRVLENGVFFAAGKLYGLEFLRREDLTAYHADARVYQVNNDDGSACGLYIFDPYARTSKRGGAWMNNLVDQSILLEKLPVVVNNMNIPKPATGDAALMTFDEVSTLFHEFGHALHGLLSNVLYPRFSGTNVERDFVEFPSQVNEMWMLWPEVLENYAVHFETGEKLSLEWVDKLSAAEGFNQGFETTHYLQAAILDLALHEAPETPDDIEAFEAKAIKDYGLDFRAVPTRYRPNYFAHIFAGGYAAGYYGYIWSEILDADTVEWFKEHGGLTRENGRRFSDHLLSRGGSKDSMELVAEFLGRAPKIGPLLNRRGLN
jgi:peptidyl-dipeptidase Dcp